MTLQQIEKQISNIREATARAMVSPEAAAAFLEEAGIFLEPKAGSSANYKSQHTPPGSSGKRKVK